jgi:hypothetical protein
MSDKCRFEKEDSEIVEDKEDPTVKILYPFYTCDIISEGLSCPFPARQCSFKNENVDPTVEGIGIAFTDGSLLEKLP